MKPAKDYIHLIGSNIVHNKDKFRIIGVRDVELKEWDTLPGPVFDLKCLQLSHMSWSPAARNFEWTARISSKEGKPLTFKVHLLNETFRLKIKEKE